ncbi:MAG: hypothetical protein ACKVT2_18195, partial [Saprospiraceae bacterium]
REINQTQPYSDKLVKFIPTEIVGAYLMLAGFLGFGPGAVPTGPGAGEDDILIIVVFSVLLLLVPAYMWVVSSVRHIIQIVIATISFAVWVYSLGGPFEVWGLSDPKVAAVILVLWTLIPPLFVRANPQNPVPPPPPPPGN